MYNLSSFWHKEPFIRLLLCLVAGIIPGLYVAWYISPIMAGIIIAMLASIVWVVYYVDKDREYIGYVLSVSIIALGFISARMQDDRASPYCINNIKPQASYILGYISTDIELKKGKETALVTITRYADKAGRLHLASGKLLLYTPPAGLQYGADIAIQAKDIQDIRTDGNPGAFDYKTYLYKQHIYATAFTTPAHIALGHINHLNILKSAAMHFNRYTLAQIETYVPDKEAQGILEALLIGYKVNIDEATIQAYTDGGVIHVMAVSGTQVALIYLLIESLFFLFKRNKRSSLWQWLLTVCCIWVFTAMAGFSGSVVRAAVMFTFISYGRYLNRYTGMYNMMAASAFFIFLFDVYAITDVGLQLSYVAVWGIVFLHRKIYTLLTIQNKILDIGWRLACVSISAQVVTLPLLLYYFRQFPLFFIPANLLAIPITTVALYAGICIVCVGALLPFIAKAIAFITIPLIHVLDVYLFGLQQYKWAVVYTGSWSFTETCLLAILVVSVLAFLIYKYKASLYTSLGTFLVLMCIHACISINQYRTHSIVVLNTGHNTAYCMISGQKAVLLCDTAYVKKSYFLKNYFTKYARSQGITSWTLAPLHTPLP